MVHESRAIQRVFGTRLGWCALALLVAVGGIALLRQRSHRTPRTAAVAVVATRGDIVVSVGGVGRIVDGRSANALVLPAGSGGGAASAAGTSASSAPPGSVFPRASGSIARLLVASGAHVVAGQPIAVLDDRGASAAALRQSETDVASARAELRQKQTSDPAKGLPPTVAEITAGRAAIDAAQSRLARLLGAPRPADVGAARAEVRRALADEEALRGGTSVAHRRAIALARRTVELTTQRLSQLLAPPNPADVSAGAAEVKKAEAELAALQAAPPAAAPEALAAAHQAVATAQAKLVAAQAAGVPADISTAQLELAKAVADLAALKQPAAPPSQAALASAQGALEAARLKLAKVLAPALPADQTAARLEQEKAQSELRALLAGPNPAALSAADQAVRSARAKLAQVLGPPLKADLTSARSDLRRAEADLAVLRARGGPAAPQDIVLARLRVRSALDRRVAARLGRRLLIVRSPIGGTVTSVLTARGAPVDVATPVASVADLTRLAVSVDLNEFDVARVRRGQPAVVRVDALGGRAFAGRVTYVSAIGSNSGGLVTFPVTVELADVHGLRAGMNVSVRVIVKQRRRVVSIPLGAAWQDANGRDVVTVLGASGGTSTRRVTLGLTSKDHVEIVKGLASGERIIPGGSGQGG